MAFSKTGNSDDAEDLVQETFLCTLKEINKGTDIENIKAYLFKVLHNRFNDSLRVKKNKMLINYDDNFHNTDAIIDSNTELKKTNEAIAIRKELAYLSNTYREILVQFYMHGKSINEIAKNLNLKSDVVKMRLCRGREKIKKGVAKMDSYTDNSFYPDSLMLLMSGSSGMNNEPLSVVLGSIEQNLLILAYDSPLTIQDLSKKIGVPMAFIEGIVDKLVRNELMDVNKNKVQTNFLIVDEKTISDKIDAQKMFIDSHFNEIKPLLENLINDYQKTNIFRNYDKVQLLLYGLVSLHRSACKHLIDTFKLLSYDDFPDRPYGGKWIINYAKRTKKIDKEKSHLSGYFIRESTIDTLNKVTTELWDHPFGKLPWLEATDSNIDNTMTLLYRIYKKLDIEPLSLWQIPELINLGFIKINSNNERAVNFPIISSSEYAQIMTINQVYAEKYINILDVRLIDFVKENAIVCPKHIKIEPPFTFLAGVKEMALTYMFKAIETGMVSIEEGRNYPVCVIVE